MQPMHAIHNTSHVAFARVHGNTLRLRWAPHKIWDPVQSWSVRNLYQRIAYNQHAIKDLAEIGLHVFDDLIYKLIDFKNLILFEDNFCCSK